MDDAYCFCGNRVPWHRQRYCCYRFQEWAQHLAAYGIDVADYEQLLRIQGGACALRLRPFRRSGFAPVVDHDHQTGAVRGLLCRGCNRKIAFFERGHRVVPIGSTLEDFVARAALYLDRGRDPASPRRRKAPRGY